MAKLKHQYTKNPAKENQMHTNYVKIAIMNNIELNIRLNRNENLSQHTLKLAICKLVCLSCVYKSLHLCILNSVV